MMQSCNHCLRTQILALMKPSSQYDNRCRFTVGSPSLISCKATRPPRATLKAKQITHSMPPEKVEVFNSLESWASQNLLPLLKPVEQSWQPQNMLPDPSLPWDEFRDQVNALRDQTAELPEEYLVVLVGDMITEDALPTYQSSMNTWDGVMDVTGSSPNAWAAWNRSWAAEEKRHGYLLKTYLYLSGRVDMLMIEKTIQYLIGAGMALPSGQLTMHSCNHYLRSQLDALTKPSSQYENRCHLTVGSLPLISCTATRPPQRALLKTKQITHSMPPEMVEVFNSLESWASQTLLPLLKPVEQSWQPQNMLPDPSLPWDEFRDQVKALRDRTAELPKEYLVVLVGNMITEDALPTYQSSMNTCHGVRDVTGSSPNAWAAWNRCWAAEEKRHGDLLKTYLYLSGRVDMLMIEKTIQYLIGAGMDIRTENNPYLGFVYTSFQERATFISHSNTARLAKESGDPVLARICGTIAADEKRHESAYTRVVEKLLEVDPSEAMLAIANMMHKNITMPAHLMYDGRDPKLFTHFSMVASKIGVYTANDYADILEFLVGRWRLEKLEGLNGEGKRARDFVCGLAPRIRKLLGRADEKARKTKKSDGIKFSWIFNKEVVL